MIRFISHGTVCGLLGRFEEDGEIQLNFTPAEQIPTTLIPSPPPQKEQKG